MKTTRLITLGSYVTVNTTDTEHLGLHPSFVRPTDPFTIKSIRKVTGGTDGQDRHSVYADPRRFANTVVKLQTQEP